MKYNTSKCKGQKIISNQSIVRLVNFVLYKKLLSDVNYAIVW